MNSVSSPPNSTGYYPAGAPCMVPKIRIVCFALGPKPHNKVLGSVHSAPVCSHDSQFSTGCTCGNLLPYMCCLRYIRALCTIFTVLFRLRAEWDSKYLKDYSCRQQRNKSFMLHPLKGQLEFSL